MASPAQLAEHSSSVLCYFRFLVVPRTAGRGVPTSSRPEVGDISFSLSRAVLRQEEVSSWGGLGLRALPLGGSLQRREVVGTEENR